MSVRILIADCHDLVLEGLAAVLEKETDLELIGRARGGQEAVKLSLELAPDILITAISLPAMNGIEVTRRLSLERPETKILCLSMHREKQYVSAALEAGASGYLMKDHASENLIQAIRSVVGDGVYLDPIFATGMKTPPGK